MTRNQGTFKPGHKRSPESIERQRETIRKRVAEGTWDQVEHLGKPGPNPRKGLKGEAHPKYLPIGTKRVVGHGYVKVKVADPNVWKYEHRVVASQKMGRDLDPGEVVHHLNGNKQDNRWNNLIVITKSEHDGIPKSKHGWPRCKVCGYKHPPH